MNVVSRIFILFFLGRGIVAYTVTSHNERTEFVTIMSGFYVPQLVNNNSEQQYGQDVSASNDLTELELGSQVKDEGEGEVTAAPPRPPPPDDAARMARFIVHYSLWGSLSHISHQPHVTGAPLARVYSISDGPFRASSGIPYFYLTPNDPELRDMFRDSRASLTLTLAQSPYCRIKSYDPEDPRCAQVILTGKLVVLKNSTAEWHKAQEALFSRHPVMRKWPESHHWVCCKLEIYRILVADNFGGNKYPSVDQYFRAHPNFCSQDDPLAEMALY